MPTGYTAGIVDGTTKDFKTFAKQCMRNFGALIHMRDEPFNKEYEPRVPSHYHSDSIKALEQKLLEIKDCSLKKIASSERESLKKAKESHLKRISEIRLLKNKLESILEVVNKYTPPSDEHEGIKAFMIQQLSETIRHDGEDKYYLEMIISIDFDLSNIDPQKIKEKRIAEHKANISYHKEEYRKDLERCDNSNKWVEQFLGSL